ncbi:MAG: hypothetical protein IH587_14145, partial [Anaerolineae bacterium]|nr:hypothetical protein [Anaerolineae bacterium]
NTLLYLAAWEILVIVILVFLMRSGSMFSDGQESLQLVLFFIVLGAGLAGLALLPLRGRFLASAHANRIDHLQARYVETIGKAAEKQIDYGMQLRRASVAPLTRLVEAQTSIQSEQLRTLQEAQQDIVKIEGELGTLGKSSFLGLRG